MTDALHGHAYRAVTRLSNGDDDVTYAEAGETCERVPVESLERLLTHGYIEPLPPPEPPPQRRESDQAPTDATETAWADLGRPDPKGEV